MGTLPKGKARNGLQISAGHARPRKAVESGLRQIYGDSRSISHFDSSTLIKTSRSCNLLCLPCQNSMASGRTR